MQLSSSQLLLLSVYPHLTLELLNLPRNGLLMSLQPPFQAVQSLGNCGAPDLLDILSEVSLGDEFAHEQNEFLLLEAVLGGRKSAVFKGIFFTELLYLLFLERRLV